jgi:dienelactone hydrolase
MYKEALTYQADGLVMRSQLMFEKAPMPRAAVLVFPEAFGLDAHAIERAERLASLGYVALACDLHGEALVVDDLQQAMTMLQPLFDDPARTRARAFGALRALAARSEVDPTRIAAIGFCFPMSIELARSGAPIKAAVGFHTSLKTKAPVSGPGKIKGSVLVCIGADDPFIPASHRAEFESEMRSAGAEWELIVYGGTVHSFTNQEAAKRNMPESIRYSQRADSRAWASALELLSRLLK